MTLITADRLSAFYENREIFSNLSFKINSGDYLCIAGENGSGKTTLMRLILGFGVRHTGAVILNGVERSTIGWLPQRTDAQKDFPAGVWEVVMSGFASAGLFSYRENRKMAEENMKLLEIADLKNRAFRELSGGQQQKVLLCRALCAANKVLLLDEPVTGLDTAARDELYAIIQRLNAAGMTVIMITHDLPRAAMEASHILHLADNGYFFGTAAEYLASDVYKGTGGTAK